MRANSPSSASTDDNPPDPYAREKKSEKRRGSCTAGRTDEGTRRRARLRARGGRDGIRRTDSHVSWRARRYRRRSCHAGRVDFLDFLFEDGPPPLDRLRFRPSVSSSDDSSSDEEEEDVSPSSSSSSSSLSPDSSPSSAPPPSPPWRTGGGNRNPSSGPSNSRSSAGISIRSRTRRRFSAATLSPPPPSFASPFFLDFLEEVNVARSYIASAMPRTAYSEKYRAS
mmetsp:Transcript_42703/g.129726  ORF Transcript_42703/g.129726 Transcript_42703/m.129726 type:complete len:225 (+) Transcript_42703:980-1654(+)